MTSHQGNAPWVLLFGGASETGFLAHALAETGHRVLVSTVTDSDLGIDGLAGVDRHVGVLDGAAMVGIMRAYGVQRVVIATHPYAVVVAANAMAAANELCVPHVRYLRPPGAPPSEEGGDLVTVDSHEEAAQHAFAVGGPVLLTTGSRHLAPYVQAAARTSLPVVVRVLNRPESVQACREAGIPDSHVIAGKGPFGTTTNLDHLRRYRIAALVTKDGGRAGGLDSKLAAARKFGCRVVLVRRPPVDEDHVCRSLEQVVAWCGEESACDQGASR
jgi:precorrin-6A/cobalt-precorrin-6A reductase